MPDHGPQQRQRQHRRYPEYHLLMPDFPLALLLPAPSLRILAGSGIPQLGNLADQILRGNVPAPFHMGRLQSQIHIGFGDTGHPGQPLLDSRRACSAGHTADGQIHRLSGNTVAQGLHLGLQRLRRHLGRIICNSCPLQRQIHIGLGHPVHPRQPLLDSGCASRAGHACNLKGALGCTCGFHPNHLVCFASEFSNIPCGGISLTISS
ncbi:hypothetical protein D3C75_649130 [compost metagenome]